MSKVLKRLVGTDGGGIKADLNAFTLARHGYFCPSTIGSWQPGRSVRHARRDGD